MLIELSPLARRAVSEIIRMGRLPHTAGELASFLGLRGLYDADEVATALRPLLGHILGCVDGQYTLPLSCVLLAQGAVSTGVLNTHAPIDQRARREWRSTIPPGTKAELDALPVEYRSTGEALLVDVALGPMARHLAITASLIEQRKKPPEGPWEGFY